MWQGCKSPTEHSNMYDWTDLVEQTGQLKVASRLGHLVMNSPISNLFVWTLAATPTYRTLTNLHLLVTMTLSTVATISLYHVIIISANTTIRLSCSHSNSSGCKLFKLCAQIWTQIHFFFLWRHLTVLWTHTGLTFTISNPLDLMKALLVSTPTCIYFSCSCRILFGIQIEYKSERMNISFTIGVVIQSGRRLVSKASSQSSNLCNPIIYSDLPTSYALSITAINLRQTYIRLWSKPIALCKSSGSLPCFSTCDSCSSEFIISFNTSAIAAFCSRLYANLIYQIRRRI